MDDVYAAYPRGAVAVLGGAIALRLGHHVGAFDFNLGCSGYVVGLQLAKCLVETRSARNVLFITTDTYSKLVHRKDRAVRTLFGDGAAAVVLQPGESLVQDVVLSSYYDFSASGSYQVVYYVSSEDLFSGLEDSAGRITSNSLELFIEGRQTPRPDEVIIAAVTVSNSFSASCTASMQTNLINARNNASTYANDAATVLGNGWHGARYTTWFGAYDPGRFPLRRIILMPGAQAHIRFAWPHL